MWKWRQVHTMGDSGEQIPETLTCPAGWVSLSGEGPCRKIANLSAPPQRELTPDKPFHPGLSQGPCPSCHFATFFRARGSAWVTPPHTLPRKDQTRGSSSAQSSALAPFPAPTAVPAPLGSAALRPAKSSGVSRHLRRTRHTHPTPIPDGRARPLASGSEHWPPFPFFPASSPMRTSPA